VCCDKDKEPTANISTPNETAIRLGFFLYQKWLVEKIRFRLKVLPKVTHRIPKVTTLTLCGALAVNASEKQSFITNLKSNTGFQLAKNKANTSHYVSQNVFTTPVYKYN